MSLNPNVQQADLSGETRRLEKWLAGVGLFALALLVAGFVTGDYQPFAIVVAIAFLVAASWLWSVAVDRMFHKIRHWSRSHAPQPVARQYGRASRGGSARALREIGAGPASLSLRTLVQSGALPVVRLSTSSSDPEERLAALKMEAAERLKELASQLEAHGKPEEAGEVLRSAEGAAGVAADETSAALNLAKSGDYERAAAALEELVTKHPSGAAWYSLGVCQGMLGRAEEARASLLKSAELGPETSSLRLALGAAHAELGQYDGAAKQLEAALAMDDQSAAAHGALGEVLLATGETQQAATSLGKALALDPGLAFAHAALGRLSYQQGNNSLAAREFEEALKADPGSGDLVFNYAAALAASGSSDQIVSLLKPVVDESADPDLAHMLAEALERSGRPEEARKYLAKTAELAPSSDAARVGLARSLRLEGRLEEARAQAEAAVRDNPRSASALVELGLVVEASGDREGALNHYRAAASLDRASVAALTELGRLTLASGQEKEAAKLLKQASGLPGATAETFLWLGEAQLGLEKPLLALESLREAQARAQERRGDICYATGRAMLAAGRVREAAEELRRARKLLGEAPEVERDLGYALHRMRNYQDAVRSLRAYLAARPDAADASEIRALIARL